MLMRKNVNNDVSKDSPIGSLIITVTATKTSLISMHLRSFNLLTFPVCEIHVWGNSPWIKFFEKHLWWNNVEDLQKLFHHK